MVVITVHIQELTGSPVNGTKLVHVFSHAMSCLEMSWKISSLIIFAIIIKHIITNPYIEQCSYQLLYNNLVSMHISIACCTWSQ